MTTEPPNLKPLSRPRPLSAAADPAPPRPTPIKKPGPTLTFSDGLNFGCGFWVAGFLFTVVAIPTAAAILAALAGFLMGMAGYGR